MNYLVLDHIQRQRLGELAQAGSPYEVCGFVAGKDNTALELIPIENIDANPEKHFTMHQESALQAFKHLDDTGQSILAIYHSHPSGLPVPSQEDIREMALNFPGVPQLIIAGFPRQIQIGAWSIDSDHAVSSVDLFYPGERSGISRLTPAQSKAVLHAAWVAFLLLLIVAVTLLPAAPPLN